MKSFFRLVLLALVLLVIALVSALTAMRIAIHGREVTVPNVVGKSPQEARIMSEPSGLQIVVERQYYSQHIVEGKILSQIPAEGTHVRRGWSIRVAESLGPQRVAIPNVMGDSRRAAEINIRRRGLDIGTVASLPLVNTTPDQVLAQSPSPNASGDSAPKISLLLAEAPQPQAFVMPSFAGQLLGSVTLSLQDAGLRVGNVSTLPDTSVTPGLADVVPGSPPPIAPASPSSVIVSQTPAAGEKVLAGTAVSFQVR